MSGAGAHSTHCTKGLWASTNNKELGKGDISMNYHEKRTLSQASTRFQIPYSHSMIVSHGEKEFSTRVKRQGLNPTIMADLSNTQIVNAADLRKKRLTNVHRHCPRRASQSLIVLSREAVMTKDMPNESTFNDCAFAGCI